VEELCRD